MGFGGLPARTSALVLRPGCGGSPSVDSLDRAAQAGGDSRPDLIMTSKLDQTDASRRVAVVDLALGSMPGRGRVVPSIRVRWAIVAMLTVMHPILLYGLHPLVGDAINTTVLVGPVVATLMFSFRVGLAFVVVNSFVSGALYWQLEQTSFEHGLPKAAVSLVVTTSVCWGANRLRQFIEQRRAMEAALHQAQNLEAIGRLAAGVAHDINNTLNAIMGSTFSLRHELAALGRSFQDLDNIALACDRGAQLTRNLLGFSRKSRAREETISLNSVAREVQSLLTRTMRQDFTFVTLLTEPPPLIMGNEAQVQHAVMNLCLNAIDAMEDNGTLTVKTELAGARASISVSDTGTGMPASVREHAFEPFFTTKPLGKGTGMGLSMVHTTVHAMRGTITVETAIGLGTTIGLSFPAATAPAPSAASHALAVVELQLLKGRTVLLIDDEPLVLRAGARMLSAMGCKVLTAKNGPEGIELLVANHAVVSLAIIDLVMPNMDGIATMHEMLTVAPELPVLLASGYTADESKIGTLLRVHPTLDFLAKPYDPAALVTAAAKLLPPNSAAPPSSRRAMA